MAKYSLITQLMLNTGDYQKGINKMKKETQQFANTVEGISKGAKYLGGLAAGFLAVGTATAVASKLINATTDSGDNFAATMEGMKQATDEFFIRIATGNFDNLLQGLKDAAELGENYANILDLIQDRKRSLTATESVLNKEIAELNEIYSNKTNSKDERLQALDEIIKKEKELENYKLKIANEQYNASLSLMLKKKDWTQQEQKDIEELLLTFNDADELRAAAVEYAEQKSNANIKGDYGYGSAAAVNIMKERSLKYLSKLTDEQKLKYEKYFEILTMYTTKGDVTIDNFVQNFANLNNIISESQQKINGLVKKKSSLELGIGENDEKLEKETEQLAEQEALLQLKWQYQEKYNKAIDRLGEITKKNKIGLPDANRNITVTKNSKGEKAGYMQLSEVIKIDEENLKTRAEIAAEQFAESFNSEVGYILEDGLSSTLFDAVMNMGEIMANGEGADWGELILGNLVTVLQKLGQLAIAAGVATLGIKKAFEDLNGVPAIVAGTALIALAAGTKAALKKQSENFKGYATGGIIGGYSFSGDNQLIRVNSGEMVLNKSQQSQLFAIANGASVGGGSVEFEIRGDKLYGVLNNYGKKLNTWR